MYFFFSSRRRHTSWTGDWSSDVCSSDLGILETRALGFGPAAVSDFLNHVVTPMRWEGGGAEIALTLLTMVLATALFVGALRIRPWTAYAPWAQRLLERKYYFDEIYDAVFVRPLDWVAGF